MTVITINEYKSEQELLNYLKEYNLLPTKYKEARVYSDYFINNQNGTYTMNVIVTFNNEYVEEYNYIIKYIDKETVIVKNNDGPIILTTFILLLLIVFILSYKVIKNVLKKRKKVS